VKIVAGLVVLREQVKNADQFPTVSSAIYDSFDVHPDNDIEHPYEDNMPGFDE